MNLILIESPGKIKKIKESVGSGYEILSTIGHIFDLPIKKLGIDIKNNFAYEMVAYDDKKDVLKNIISTAKKANHTYLMTDADREGEGIAFNIKNALIDAKVDSKKISRISTTEITKSGIKKALDNPGDVNMQMTDAYLTRRILDRICGYKVSFLTQQSTGGKSAGRVQSAMLRIIAEREKEIKAFIPEEYWVLTAHLQTKDKSTYLGILDEKIKVKNEQEATKIYDKVIKGSPFVKEVESQEVNVSPYAPFTTSTLIQSSSTILGWAADKTMKVAQTLYEMGKISYHRSDSPFMAEEAMTAVRNFIEHSVGIKYLNSTVQKYSAKKGAQEGHECCRPTDISLQTVSGTPDQQKMYEMIWRRAIASQMVNGIDKRTKVITDISDYDFISRGNTCVFDGFRKIWVYSKHEDNILPDLKKGDKPALISLDKEQKWTSPPSRYSDASLQKKCDSVQITRPATFASFLKILENRGYIKRVKKSFEATDLGIRVVDFLIASHMCFVDLEFTANMEQNLDDIATGTKKKLDVMTDFWKTLKDNIEYAKTVKTTLSETNFICPKCNGKVLRKYSKYGPFMSCANYKKKGGCDYVANVGENGELVEKVVKEKEYADFNCNKCGSKMVKRTSKFGSFFGCEGFNKGCKVTADLDGNFKVPKTGGKKKFWQKKKKDVED